MSRPATSSWHWLRSEEQPSSRRRLSVVVVGGGSFVHSWGALKTPLTSRNADLLEEHPQVKRGSTHSRSEAFRHVWGRFAIGFLEGATNATYASAPAVFAETMNSFAARLE